MTNEDFCRDVIEYFGEENVDIRYSSPFKPFDDAYKSIEEEENKRLGLLYIIIRWKSAKVTDDNGVSTTIYDLFCCFKIFHGLLQEDLDWIKTTYTANQFLHGYTHSHLPQRSLDEPRKMCLGESTLKHIVSALKSTDKITEGIYKLFCIELNKAVHTESIAGGPYMKLSSLATSAACGTRLHFDVFNSNYIIPEKIKPIIVAFLRDYLKNFNLPLVFDYDSGFSFGCSNKEVNLRMSNSFIGWYKNLPEQIRDKYPASNLFMLGALKDNELYKLRNSDINSDNNTLIIFKNQPIPLKIIKDNTKIKPLSILRFDIVSFIALQIINFLNLNTHGSLNRSTKVVYTTCYR